MKKSEGKKKFVGFKTLNRAVRLTYNGKCGFRHGCGKDIKYAS